MPKQTEKYKLTVKDYLKLFAVLAFVGGLIFFALKAAGTPIPTPTDTQVWDTLTANGYTPIDQTEQYVKDNPTMGIERNITCISDGLRAEVFIFNEQKFADAAYGSIVTDLGYTERKYYNNNIRTGGYRANFVIYTLKAGGKYYYLMRIDNTLFYAYCDEEHISEVNSIAKELGYIR